MKKITCESGLRINLPDHAYIEIWEQAGEYLVDIFDYNRTVQICYKKDEKNKAFKYISDLQNNEKG